MPDAQPQSTPKSIIRMEIIVKWMIIPHELLNRPPNCNADTIR